MRSLSLIGVFLLLAGLAMGFAGSLLWVRSNAAWHSYQQNAYIVGLEVFDALQRKTKPPTDVAFLQLSKADQELVNKGLFDQISHAPRPALVTHFSLLLDSVDGLSGQHLAFVILSSDLRYPLAELQSAGSHSRMDTVGQVFRQLARYCSHPVVMARIGDAPWVNISGAKVWGCDAAPNDYRLIIALLMALLLAALMTYALNIPVHFSQFARLLLSRRRLGGPDSYDIKGPRELQEIVSAVNGYLMTERDQLEKRAIVLSGISHDLGTPATRLRLRAALIPDQILRQKLEADIDRMTGMIESVLTYTRSELNSEIPRKLSLSSLIDAIVANYQDTGQAVRVIPVDDVVIKGVRSVFMSHQSQSILSDEQQIIVMARPVSLERAICNLIDNAVKYGRSATVAVKIDAEYATIIIEDEGTQTKASDMAALIAPFQRGAGLQSIDGHGLGLTIVEAIAILHGGTLKFADTPHGLQARLTINRL